MKKLYSFLTFCLLAATVVTAQAQTIRRVNNTGIAGVDVSGTNIYSTVQLAHNAATAGDIVQLEPSTTSYGQLTCTKKLTIVGPGYFLSQNQPPALQAGSISATIDNIYYSTGSANSVLTGVTVSGSVLLSTNNISLLRNNIASYVYIGYQGAASDLLIRQNYIGVISYYGYVCNNVLITNNIITSSVSLNSASVNGEFSNNVVTYIYGSSYFNNFIVRNNYFSGTFVPTANTEWSNNLLQQSTLPALGTQANNTANVPQASVFVLAPTGPGQFDAWYQLKAGTNPARGTGQGGTDIGAFGGATGYAYRLSGIPAIPTIYQLNQSVSGNTLNVTISTRSNN